jgi:hypothetical protein
LADPKAEDMMVVNCANMEANKCLNYLTGRLHTRLGAWLH